jgi:N-acetylmuramoyl-L-alanine amidase
MRHLKLPDALRRYGLTVELVPGWETRGSDAFNPRGSVAHHTAGPRTGDRPSLAICVRGRSDLPGPLCQVFLCRHGHAIVVAAGRANHAGRGGWRGLVGNSSVFGCEAEDDGDGTWTQAQLWAYPRVHAAFHSLPGMADAGYCCGHKEWTSRKPDPGGIAMSDFRSQVADLCAGVEPLPLPIPANQEELPDMIVGQDQATGKIWLISGNTKLEFPQGGGANPYSPGHGNVYVDELLLMIRSAYPGTNPTFVALNHDIVERIPGVFSLVEPT